METAFHESDRLRCQIKGDVMMPAYSDGLLVEFEVLGADSSMQPGADYLLFGKDGKVAFRRLIARDGESLIVACLNQKQYPGSFTAPLDQIAYVAKVLCLLLPPPPDRPLQISKPKRAS